MTLRNAYSTTCLLACSLARLLCLAALLTVILVCISYAQVHAYTLHSEKDRMCTRMYCKCTIFRK